MVEIEKKFRLTQEQERQLLEGATSMGVKKNTDIYFDTEDFVLTRQDHWLRERNGRFEVKKRLHELGWKQGGTSYDEIETEEGVRAFLELPVVGSLGIDLARAGYKPFAHIVTTRRSFERDGFHIDLDEADFGYTLAEIELMIENPSEQQAALDRINAFALRMGIIDSRTRGKVIEYLSRFSPLHYQALQDAGVINDV